MTDIITELKQRFGWAMDVCLDAYEALPDGKSFERSDEDEDAIEKFGTLRDTVGAIPQSLIQATEELRATVPELFEETFAHRVQIIGGDFAVASATEFLEMLNTIVQRGSSSTRAP